MHWSFSGLMTYETCALRFKFKYIDRLPEPPQPPENPLVRGNRIHKNLELFVQGETQALTNEARAIEKFKPALEHARMLYEHGMATTEQDWTFNPDWNPCDKNDPDRYIWAKLDLSIRDPLQLLAISIDHKSGKSTYKAIEHVQQTQFYAALSAIRFPDSLEHITELWYVDEGWVRQARYTQEEALRFVGRFEQRAQRIYADKFFRPNPTAMTCKWCPYSPRGTGVCPVGV